MMNVLAGGSGLEHLVGRYGYAAILLGTFFEGETILVIGGFMAHRGYLALSGVILAAFLGSMAGDQLFFMLGRRHGPAVLARRPSWTGRVHRVNGLLRRYQTLVILGFRFVYGMRTATPFVLGLGDVPAIKFLALNMVSALVWATVIAGGGYLFGHVLDAFLGDLRRYELLVLAGLAAAGAALWLRHRLKRNRNGDAPSKGAGG